jgi:hypothetical protein
MALADPQSIKISGVTSSLPRVKTKDGESTYMSSDGLIKLTLSTVEGKRKRHVYRVDVEKVTADPFIPAQNVSVSMSVYIVVDRPLVGYNNAEALAVVTGLLEAASETSYSDVTKLLGSES